MNCTIDYNVAELEFDDLSVALLDLLDAECDLVMMKLGKLNGSLMSLIMENASSMNTEGKISVDCRNTR